MYSALQMLFTYLLTYLLSCVAAIYHGNVLSDRKDGNIVGQTKQTLKSV